MVLATIIRLEMAYPGVGILAGDSLQYLSVVTAHAVIMVFFMIMPLLFGAWGNFLLPTQLGVHDVAFPRLNSAAFWFLPAGLLMLVQLVCLDRRYQRMNCYNIREIQTILKSKYAPASSDSADVHFNLNDTAIGLRYQIGGLDFIDPAMFTYYRNALATHPRYRAIHEFLHKPIVEFDSVKLFMSRCSFMFSTLKMMFEDDAIETNNSFESVVSSFVPYTASSEVSSLRGSLFSLENFGDTQLIVSGLQLTVSEAKSVMNSLSVQNLSQWLVLLMNNVASRVPSSALVTLDCLNGAATSLSKSLQSLSYNKESGEGLFNRFFTVTSSILCSVPALFSFSNTATLSNSYFKSLSYGLVSKEHVAESGLRDELYSSASSQLSSVEELPSAGLQEQSSDSRFSRAMNPVFKYDFKVGNYLPDDAKKLNPHLFMTMKDITTGIRKSS